MKGPIQPCFHSGSVETYSVGGRCSLSLLVTLGEDSRPYPRVFLVLLQADTVNDNVQAEIRYSGELLRTDRW